MDTEVKLAYFLIVLLFVSGCFGTFEEVVDLYEKWERENVPV